MHGELSLATVGREPREDVPQVPRSLARVVAIRTYEKCRIHREKVRVFFAISSPRE